MSMVEKLRVPGSNSCCSRRRPEHQRGFGQHGQLQPKHTERWIYRYRYRYGYGWKMENMDLIWSNHVPITYQSTSLTFFALFDKGRKTDPSLWPLHRRRLHEPIRVSSWWSEELRGGSPNGHMFFLRTTVQGRAIHLVRWKNGRVAL